MDAEKVLIIIGVVIVLFFSWYFGRPRCNKCKSFNVKLLNQKKVDQYTQMVKVSERTSTGKSRQRHVRKTFVEIRESYQCIDCGNAFSRNVKREK